MSQTGANTDVSSSSESPSNTNGRHGNNETTTSHTRDRARRTTTQTQNQIQLSNPTNYEGETPEIGCVIGMKYEKFDRKVPFETFLENMNNYAITNLKDGATLQSLFLDKKDPIDAFKKEQRPTALDENADDVDKEIFKESIKQYVSMETNARRNLQKTYGLM